MRNILTIVSLVLVLAGCTIFQRAEQRKIDEQAKTIDAMRDVGTAIEAYKLANGKYPVASSGHLEQIEGQLVPLFLRELPEEDGWGNELEYYCRNPEGPYFIISLGADKTRDVGLYKTDHSPSGLGFTVISDLKEDIIFSNGTFVRYPQNVKVAGS